MTCLLPVEPIEHGEGGGGRPHTLHLLPDHAVIPVTPASVPPAGQLPSSHDSVMMFTDIWFRLVGWGGAGVGLGWGWDLITHTVN